MEDYSIYRGSGWCATVCCINLLELSLPRSPQFLRHHCFEWEGKQGSQGVLQVNLHPGTVWQVQWRNSEVHQDPWQHEEKSPGRKHFKKSDKQVKQLHLLSNWAVLSKTTHATYTTIPRVTFQMSILGWFSHLQLSIPFLCMSPLVTQRWFMTIWPKTLDLLITNSWPILDQDISLKFQTQMIVGHYIEWLSPNCLLNDYQPSVNWCIGPSTNTYSKHDPKSVVGNQIAQKLQYNSEIHSRGFIPKYFSFDKLQKSIGNLEIHVFESFR